MANIKKKTQEKNAMMKDGEVRQNSLPDCDRMMHFIHHLGEMTNVNYTWIRCVYLKGRKGKGEGGGREGCFFRLSLLECMAKKKGELFELV